MKLFAWPEIESFFNIRKYTKAHPEILNGSSVVQYRAKVKLHGTNAAVQCHADGQIVAQSRETVLSIGADNAGFARWVAENEAAWKQVETRGGPAFSNMIVYGEWAGPGIQKGVAVSQLDKKIFAVFAARSMNPDEDRLIVDPTILAEMVRDIPNTYILPWYDDGKEYQVDWSSTAEQLGVTVEQINLDVLAIETNDPWIEATFNVKGTGEGLVFYPRTSDHIGFANFSNLVFKAKGEKHKNIGGSKPAQVDASVAASQDEFIQMVLTPARLEQGAGAVSPDGKLQFNMSLTGKFIAWISADVLKETEAELEASNLDWKQVQRPLSEKARAWYIMKAKEL